MAQRRNGAMMQRKVIQLSFSSHSIVLMTMNDVPQSGTNDGAKHQMTARRAKSQPNDVPQSGTNDGAKHQMTARRAK
jgi:hypothetical protein